MAESCKTKTKTKTACLPPRPQAPRLAPYPDMAEPRTAYATFAQESGEDPRAVGGVARQGLELARREQQEA